MPAPVELLLPASLDTDAAVALLARRLELEPGRATTEDRVFLDSFDGRLRKAGLRAERIGNDVVLYEPGAPPRRARLQRARRHLVSELPDGVVKERVAGVLGPRALLPRARVRSAIQTLAMLDGDHKTVARLTIERPEVVEDGRRISLAPRLAIRPVLGYDDAYERAVRVARDRLGFAPADRPLFDAAVKAAGGRPKGVRSKPRVDLPDGTRADVAAGRVLGALADIAEANLPGAIEDVDPEFLHDVRVSIRRARSVLRELKGVHPPRARAHVRDELKWAQALTGPVRDLDVQLLEWDELAKGAARASELEALRAVLVRRREAEQAKLSRALRSKRFKAAMQAWRALSAEPPPAGEDPERPAAGTPIDELAGRRIRKVRKRMLRDGGRIDADSPAEALHDLRKRGKELRYLLELFADRNHPLVAQLKALQDVLGRHQDRATQTAFLHGLADDLAREPGGPAALIALGSVLDAVEADQRAARAEFAKAFRTFAAAT